MHPYTISPGFGPAREAIRGISEQSVSCEKGGS
jgi:hypothetical protein